MIIFSKTLSCNTGNNRFNGSRKLELATKFTKTNNNGNTQFLSREILA